jgi:nicotinate-nucleotide pyrophosphorylase (carboxylating)
MSDARIPWPPSEDVDRLIDWALAEDGGGRDVSSEVVVPDTQQGGYALVARQEGVFAGRAILECFGRRFAGEGVVLSGAADDGRRFKPGDGLAVLAGRRRVLLRIERPLLNFLQRLSGIATMTRRYVEAVSGTGVRILDTRKTLPGWRQLDKYAVRCGGGENHRLGLHDAVLVKDNHLVGIAVSTLRRAVAEMVASSRRLEPPPTFVEIEVDTLEQYREVLSVDGVDRILLDNFGLSDMREAVALRMALPGRHILLEASGNVTLQTVRPIAETGIDLISVGALTHSVPALDLAFDEIDL